MRPAHTHLMIAAATAVALLATPPSHAASVQKAAPRPGPAAPAAPRHAPASPAAVRKATAAPAPAAPAARDSGETLKGDREGTVFRSLTIEGEDRVHLDFERPALALALDPEKAPGLEWGTAQDVLDRSVPDLTAPLFGVVARQPEPRIAHPWLREFGRGAVARFRPEVKNVERWRLMVANARGETVASFDGRGDPPAEIAWDGRSSRGALVVPGLTYSYVFEAFDRAGNKRNFVGEGFSTQAFRVDSKDAVTLVFAGRLAAAEGVTGGALDPVARILAVPPLVLEVATVINQSERVRQPVRVTAAARNFAQADALGASIARMLGPLVVGDPARLQTVARVELDAPEDGTVAIDVPR